MVSFLALLAGLAAAVVVAALVNTPLPHPYDDTTTIEIEPTRVARFPRAAPNMSAAPFFDASTRKDSLLGATRLFEGRILGAESVEATSDGGLVLLESVSDDGG